MKKFLICIPALLLCAGFNSTAYAVSDAQRIKQLEARIERMEALLLHSGIGVNSPKTIGSSASKETAKKEKPAAYYSPKPAQVTIGPGPKMTSNDGEYSFKLTGRLMSDSAWYDDDSFDYADGTVLRRLWIGLEGNVGNDWFWRAEPDFSGNNVVLRDGYLRYKGLENLNVTVGQQLEPFGMSAISSSKYLTLIERGLTYALQPDRNIGLNLDTKTGKNWAVHAGVYGGNAGSTTPTDDEGNSISIRGHFNPIHNGSNFLHLGAAASYRIPNNDTIRYRSKPEAAIDDNNIVDTGAIASVDNIQLYGAELAGQWKSFSMQSEYNLARLNRDGLNDVDFDSWYINTGWLFTGDVRTYSPQSGTFGRVYPNRPFDLDAGNYGAWEVAARYSYLNLNDGNITGGKVRNSTLGLNWYPNPWVKFMFNYIMVDGDENTATASGDDPKIFLLRTQVEF